MGERDWLGRPIEALSASPVGEGMGASASPIPTEQAGRPVVGWQPIETAPKDGTMFIAYSQDVRGDTGLNPFVSLCAWHDGAGFCTCELREPTHWMPLPPAPSTTSTAEQVGTGPQVCAVCDGFVPTWGVKVCSCDYHAPCGTVPAPTPGEGEAPVAWRVVSSSGEEHGLFYDLAVAHENAKPGDTVKALYDRPTPATPEGLREKVIAALKAADAAKNEGKSLLDRTGLGLDEIADAILAALQPQAQGGE